MGQNCKGGITLSTKRLRSMTRIISTWHILVHYGTSTEHSYYSCVPQWHYLSTRKHDISTEEYGHSSDDKVMANLDRIGPTKCASDSFIIFGLIHYSHNFLNNISNLLAPLHELTRLDTKWKWDAVHQIAFEREKAMLSSSTVLAHWPSATRHSEQRRTCLWHQKRVVTSHARWKPVGPWPIVCITDSVIGKE